MPFKTTLVAGALLALAASAATAQGTGPIKVGLMLPYSGTYASLGNRAASSPAARSSTSRSTTSRSRRRRPTTSTS